MVKAHIASKGSRAGQMVPCTARFHCRLAPASEHKNFADVKSLRAYNNLQMEAGRKKMEIDMLGEVTDPDDRMLDNVRGQLSDLNRMSDVLAVDGASTADDPDLRKEINQTLYASQGPLMGRGSLSKNNPANKVHKHHWSNDFGSGVSSSKLTEYQDMLMVAKHIDGDDKDVGPYKENVYKAVALDGTTRIDADVSCTLRDSEEQGELRQVKPEQMRKLIGDGAGILDEFRGSDLNTPSSIRIHKLLSASDDGNSFATLDLKYADGTTKHVMSNNLDKEIPDEEVSGCIRALMQW